MDIIVTGRSALKLHRIARRKWPILSLHSMPMDTVDAGALDRRWLRSLNLEAFRNLGMFSQENPLDLCITHAKGRTRIPEIVNHVRSIPLPGGSYLEIHPSKSSIDEFPIRSECRIVVDSVPLTIAMIASELHKSVRCNRMTRQTAIMRLIPLICEFCGTYTHDPLNPKGEIEYNVAPASDVSEVRTYLKKLHGLRGIDIARAAANYAADLLASPMEFVVYAVLTFPPRMGGIHLCGIRVNEALSISDRRLKELGIMRLTPDFRINDWKLAIEYNGSEHLEKYRVRQDNTRAQNYVLLGYRYFPIMIDDIRPISALDRTLYRLADVLSEYGGKKLRRRIREIICNEKYHAARMELLRLYLPTVNT